MALPIRLWESSTIKTKEREREREREINERNDASDHVEQLKIFFTLLIGFSNLMLWSSCAYRVYWKLREYKRERDESLWGFDPTSASAVDIARKNKSSFHMEFKKCREHTSRVSPVELTANRNTTSPKCCPLHNFITAISYEQTILLRTSKRSVAASTVLSWAQSY